MENNKNMIITVPFSELKIWDVKSFYHQSDIFNKKYPVVLFGEFLTKPIISKVQIEDTKEYKILGARAYGKGAFVNRTVKGDTLKMRTYQQAKPNHLFWCKVDTKNGAFGIITEELADGVASSNMTFAKIETEKANPEFLQLLFKSKRINEYMDGYVSGTTNRKYIKPDQLREEINIVLPPIEEQNRIANNYKTKIVLAEKQLNEANNLEVEIEKYLSNVLGVSLQNSTSSKKGLQLVSFKNINRWDTLFLISNIQTLQSKYPIEKFQNAVINFNKGENNVSIRINSKDFPNQEFNYIGMEHIEKETGVLLELNKVKGKEIKSQTLRVPKDYFLYGKLRPYLNKYWINETEIENIICSSEFFVFKVSENINKLFFKYVLSSSFIQSQITDKTSGARMPRINEDIFFNLEFPLPPINIQEEIAEYISGIKQKIKFLRLQSEENKTNALIEFENEIFNS